MNNTIVASIAVVAGSVLLANFKVTPLLGLELIVVTAICTRS